MKTLRDKIQILHCRPTDILADTPLQISAARLGARRAAGLSLQVPSSTEQVSTFVLNYDIHTRRPRRGAGTLRYEGLVSTFQDTLNFLHVGKLVRRHNLQRHFWSPIPIW